MNEIISALLMDRDYSALQALLAEKPRRISPRPSQNWKKSRFRWFFAFCLKNWRRKPLWKWTLKNKGCLSVLFRTPG